MEKRAPKRISAEEVAEKSCQGSSFGAFRVKTELAQKLFQKWQDESAVKIEKKQRELKEVLNFDITTRGGLKMKKRKTIKTEEHLCIGPGKDGNGCAKLLKRDKNGERIFICGECRVIIEYIERSTSGNPHKLSTS